jgi:hypothetical protein
VQLSLVALAATLAARPVRGQIPQIAKATTGGDVTAPLPNVTTIKGTGVAAAFGMSGGNSKGKGAVEDPTAGGQPFDDTIPYGNSTLLTTLQTVNIGNRLLRAYPDLPNDGALPLGQSILYSVDGPSDKVGPALKQGFAAQIEAFEVASSPNLDAIGSATITSTPNANNKMAVDVSGEARASVSKNPFNPNAGLGPGFAVAIVKDPITYALTSPGMNSTIYQTVGSASSPFSLQASVPGSFAYAFFDFSTDQTGLLASFSIGIDSQTRSLGAVDFAVNDLNPILGFASNTDFENYFLSYLTFNPSDESLSASTAIPLFQFQLSDANPSVTLLYTEGAIAGVAAVPEPESLVLIGLGLAGLWVMRRTMRRHLPARGIGGVGRAGGLLEAPVSGTS